MASRKIKHPATWSKLGLPEPKNLRFDCKPEVILVHTKVVRNPKRLQKDLGPGSGPAPGRSTREQGGRVTSFKWNPGGPAAPPVRIITVSADDEAVPKSTSFSLVLKGELRSGSPL